jgi:hypothetical protein
VRRPPATTTIKSRLESSGASGAILLACVNLTSLSCTSLYVVGVVIAQQQLRVGRLSRGPKSQVQSDQQWVRVQRGHSGKVLKLQKCVSTLVAQCPSVPCATHSLYKPYIIV